MIYRAFGMCLVLMVLAGCDSDSPIFYKLDDKTVAEQPQTYEFQEAQVTSDEPASSSANISTSVSEASQCADSSLPMAIDEHGVIYEKLLITRRLSEVAAGVELRATPDEIRTLIPDHTGVIFSYAAGETLCVWLLNSQGIAALGQTAYSGASLKGLLTDFYTAENIKAEQINRAPKLRNAVIADAPVQSVDETTDELLATMSDLAFPGDIASALLDYNRLIIIPYGGLGALPYAAMPLPDGRHLIEQSEIIIAPSLYDFYSSRRAELGIERWTLASPGCDREWNRDEQSPNELSALVIGDPDYSFDTEYDMPQLQGALEEAKYVAEVFGETPLLRSDATLDAVLDKAENTNILYFATHGISHQSVGINSFIALTNSRWAARDVQQVCLRNVQLAVLSACQTGLGQTLEGGTINLARSFQRAGVRSVVMSLWNVDDAATKALMISFANQIKLGDTPSAALRHAMLETRSDFPSVRYWASFSVFSAHLD